MSRFGVHQEVRLPTSERFRRLVIWLFNFLKEPRLADSWPLTRLPSYRLTVGEYRVVCGYRDSEVRELPLGKRNDDEIYRKL